MNKKAVDAECRENFVFLGGTCNGSTWRDELVERATFRYFNPVVEDWDKQAQAKERKAKKNAACHLFVITPQMHGVYSICEATHSAHTVGVDTVFCALEEWDGQSFDERQMRSLSACMRLLLDKTSATVWTDLHALVDYLNTKYGEGGK